MMRSLFAGVAGLQNHQTQMDVIGNNIANVNTIGYKGGRVTFQDTLSQVLRGASAPSADRGGINALQVGLGMNIASIDILQTQGNLQNTGNMTDVALQGDGFFIVGNGQQQFYTRAGNFQLEKDGRLDYPSNGLMLQGWMADSSGKININTPIRGLQLPIGQTIAPVATTKIGFKGNLNAETSGELSYPSLKISDGLGHNPTVDIELTPLGFNQYQYTVKVTEGTVSGGPATGIITLDNDGNVIGSGTDFTVRPTGSTTDIIVHVPAIGDTDGGSFVSNKVGSGSVAFGSFTPTSNSSTGTLASFTGAGTYTVNTTDGEGNAVALQYVVTASGTPDRYDFTLTTTGGTVVSGGTGSFDYDGTETSNWSISQMTIQSTAGNVIHVVPPTTSVPGDPSFTITAPVPQTFTKTVTDDLNNTVTLTYKVTATTVPDQFSYTVTAAGGTVDSGGSGSFTWTSAGGASNGIIGGGLDRTVIRSTAGLEIALGPPVTAPGTPFFAVLTKQGSFEGTFEAAQPVTSITKVYDSLGAEHTFTTTMTKTDNNYWSWVCTDEAGNAIGNGTLSFSGKGKLVSATGGPLIYSPAGADPMNINPDFTKVDQYKDSESEVTSPDQDGYPMGQLQTFNIDKSGKIVGVFSNGMSQTLAQIAVANFNNPGGLMRTGESMFQESANSGSAQIGQAGQNGRGLITPGAVEMSNVNLSQEFTQMIVTQRGFQANSKIITTSDEMLQDLVNLKR